MGDRQRSDHTCNIRTRKPAQHSAVQRSNSVLRKPSSADSDSRKRDTSNLSALGSRHTPDPTTRGRILLSGVQVQPPLRSEIDRERTQGGSDQDPPWHLNPEKPRHPCLAAGMPHPWKIVSTPRLLRDPAGSTKRCPRIIVHHVQLRQKAQHSFHCGIYKSVGRSPMAF